MPRLLQIRSTLALRCNALNDLSGPLILFEQFLQMPLKLPFSQLPERPRCPSIQLEASSPASLISCNAFKSSKRSNSKKKMSAKLMLQGLGTKMNSNKLLFIGRLKSLPTSVEVGNGNAVFPLRRSRQALPTSDEVLFMAFLLKSLPTFVEVGNGNADFAHFIFF